MFHIVFVLCSLLLTSCITAPSRLSISKGGYTRAQILETMYARTPDYRRCYVELTKRVGLVSEMFAIRFTVTKDQTIENINVYHGKHSDETAKNCYRSVTHSLKFGTPRLNRSTSVVFPFEFDPKVLKISYASETQTFHFQESDLQEKDSKLAENTCGTNQDQKCELVATIHQAECAGISWSTKEKFHVIKAKTESSAKNKAESYCKSKQCEWTQVYCAYQDESNVFRKEEDVHKAVMAKSNSLRSCYNQLRKRQPGLFGSIDITLNINQDGTLVDSGISSVSDGFKNQPKFQKCINDKIASWKLPRLKTTDSLKKTFTITYK
ncbi:MAG: AgmX/PglI C-terminal domain-containing protein [Pseudobacteriovorax sp.]|nr:AgmX/PglI C-terminal domain-containing protein [Pseudobacteriovorax sp.]